MPELPEVHTIWTDLKDLVKGAIIKKIEVQKKYSILQPEPNSHQLLKNTQISTSERVGKNIVLHSNHDHSIRIHLGMTGRILLNAKSTPWDRVKMTLQRGNDLPAFTLTFVDVRKFGKFEIIEKEAALQLSQKYGIEPLNETVSSDIFDTQVRKVNSTIKNVLLNQKVISGLGNIYATDALWLAKVNPFRKTSELSQKETAVLLEACKDVLNEGIKNRGISMRDYSDLHGTKGKQQNFFKIYQKDACSRCQEKTKALPQNGRTTYFCPNCQA